ncbi:MAG: universal stress protein [Sphingomonadaceae bacterium]
MPETFEVLLASDFTARSDRPLDRALQLARAGGGKLVIAHILEKRDGDPDPETVEQLRADLPPEARDAELVIRTGSAPGMLTRIAAERGSDLIITGVARYNSIGDYVLGTAVDHIVRNADVPVLIVRRRVGAPYTHLVVATDLSDCSRAALLAAVRLFPDAAITLVHAFHVPYQGWLKSDGVKQDIRAEAQRGLDAFLAHEDVAHLLPGIEAIIDEGETNSVVIRQLQQTGADLLVLGTHGRSGFSHATIGSQAEALLAAVNVDVLMVRERKG